MKLTSGKRMILLRALDSRIVELDKRTIALKSDKENAEWIDMEKAIENTEWELAQVIALYEELEREFDE